MASTENIEMPDKERQTMFQGKNIHSSPVDGKLLCSFSEKTCMQRRLNRYAFCIRHVLEDKNAPFKQCKFVAKYNGQRCTNAIPVKEERIYCNSHLQVLGIVPKKSRKKKVNDHNQSSTKRVPKTPQTDIISNSRTSQNTISKRVEKSTNSAVTPLKPPADERSLKKAKVLSANPLLCQLVNTYSQASNCKRDLFHYYGLYSSDEESVCDEESDDGCTQETTESKLNQSRLSKPDSDNAGHFKRSSRAAKLWELRKSLHKELFGVKKSIIAHNKDVKQSTKALDLLMTSVKASPSLTAVAIQNENNTFSASSRKRSAPSRSAPIVCTANSNEKAKCERSAIPYTKYCSQHILNDSKQLLFHQCSAELPSNQKCLVSTLDLLHDKPLCRDHANYQATHVPIPPSVQASPVGVPAIVAVAPQKPPAKKARRKPQARAVPTQKPVKATKKTTKREPQKLAKTEKNKKVVNVVSSPVITKKLETVNHLNMEKPNEQFALGNVGNELQRNVDYIPNGNLKMEPLCAKNDINMFGNGEFKEPEIFDAHDMDVEGSLENEDLNIPEDLGDISPTGILRDSVLKLPLELSESRETSPVKQPRKSPVETFSMDPVSDGNLHKPIISSSVVQPPRNASHVTNEKQYIPAVRINQMNVLAGVRPSRTSVITLPKYSSNPPPLTLQRHGVPVSSADYTPFTTIGPSIVKTERIVRKPENRPMEITHGPALFPLQFDTVLNSAWGSGGGKLVINNRARPILVNTPINHATAFSPSISPHISPQIALGTAFNFDRPSVLQHSNSSSPTLSPFSATLSNSPHAKLLPRTIRFENRPNTSPNDMDPFFGASFDKP